MGVKAFKNLSRLSDSQCQALNDMTHAHTHTHTHTWRWPQMEVLSYFANMQGELYSNYSFIFVCMVDICTCQRTLNGYLGKPLKRTEACGQQMTAVCAFSQTEAHTVNASTMWVISVGEWPALLALGCIWLPICTCFYSPYIMHKQTQTMTWLTLTPQSLGMHNK